MFCVKCGNTLQEGVNFCVKCGTKVESGIPLQAGNIHGQPIIQPIVPQSHSVNVNLPVMALISIIALIIGPVFIFTINSFIGLLWPNVINIIWSIIYIGSCILGIIAFLKLIKDIGTVKCCIIILLFSIMALSSYSLFRYILTSNPNWYR